MTTCTPTFTWSAWLANLERYLSLHTLLLAKHILGGGFKYFPFSTLFGENISHFDSFFSDGLVQPPPSPPTQKGCEIQNPKFSSQEKFGGVDALCLAQFL